MKGFQRSDQLFSLCGLNCGLCPMHLGGHCGGCGAGNQSCRLARCSLEHGGVEYCFQCGEYPCENYADIDRYDSFITHQRQRADLARAREMGVEAYRAEQREKAALLALLLEKYNDGRKKGLYCLAANLLELEELRTVLRQAEEDPDLAAAGARERAAWMAGAIRAMAEERGLELKLRKRK